MAVADVRQGIKTALEQVTGYYVYEYPTASPELPCFVIQAPTVRPQEGTLSGLREQDWTVSVFYSFTDVADSMSKYDELIDGSFVQDLEAPTDAWMHIQVNSIGEMAIEEAYISAEITLTILA